MRKTKDQTGMALIESLLALLLVVAVVAAGMYVKNRSDSSSTTASQATASKIKQLRTLATDPQKAGTVSGVEAAANGSAGDDSQAQQEMESEHSADAQVDKSALNSVGGSINENEVDY